MLAPNLSSSSGTAKLQFDKIYDRAIALRAVVRRNDWDMLHCLNNSVVANNNNGDDDDGNGEMKKVYNGNNVQMTDGDEDDNDSTNEFTPVQALPNEDSKYY
eukprot:623332-Ditylum_brightwellii.AAC.1